jgi:hypothetical protein
VGETRWDLDDPGRAEAEGRATRAALRDQMRLTDLVSEFRGVFAEETIGRVADESLALLLERRVVS